MILGEMRMIKKFGPITQVVVIVNRRVIHELSDCLIYLRK